MLEEVAHASSEECEKTLRDLDEAKRQQVLGWMAQLRSKMRECLTDKLGFWNSIPFCLLGVFWCVLGGPMDKSKAILRKALAEFEIVVAQGRLSTMHRVARRLLSPDHFCGRELRAWVSAADEPLRNFPYAYVTLLEYALIPLVERRIESCHARLKHLIQKARAMLAPAVCAAMREDYNVDLLKTNPKFHKLWIRGIAVSSLTRS